MLKRIRKKLRNLVIVDLVIIFIISLFFLITWKKLDEYFSNSWALWWILLAIIVILVIANIIKVSDLKKKI